MLRRAFERESVRIVCLLAATLCVLFFPYVTGQDTFLSAAEDVPSVYPAGAAGSPGVVIYKGSDYGASGWQNEPIMGLEHEEEFKEHVFPLWNPYVAYGSPLAADMILQPYYPLTALYVTAPGPVTYNWYILARLFAGGIFAFLWLRYFFSFFPSAAGAIVFMLSGYFLLYINIAHLSVEVLGSFVIYSAERLIRRPSAVSIGVYALAVFLILMGGMPESAALALGFGFLYWLFRLVTGGELGASRLRLAAQFVAGNVVGLLSGMVMLLPLREYLKVAANQHEARFVGDQIIGLGYDPVTVGIHSYVFPLLFGPPWNSIMTGYSGFNGARGFFGIAVFLFALVALFSAVGNALRKRWSLYDSLTAFCTAAALVLVLKRYGSPLVNWAGGLPILSLVQFPKYEEAPLALAVAGLCAIGVFRVLEPARLPVVLAGLLTLGYLTAVFLANGQLVAEVAVHVEFFYGSLLFGLAIVVALGACIGIAYRVPADAFARARTKFGTALVAILLVSQAGSFIIPMYYVVGANAPAALNPYAGGPFVKYLQDATKSSRDRVFSQDAMLYPSWASAFDLSDTRALDPLLPEKYFLFVRAFFPKIGEDITAGNRFDGSTTMDLTAGLGKRWMELSSIRYLATDPQTSDDRPYQRHPELFTKVYGSDAKIYAVRDALPRAAIYYRATVAPNDAAALKLLVAPQFDPFVTGVITAGDFSDAQQSIVASLARAPASPAQKADITNYSSQNVSVTADAKAPALLILNDTAYPGWKAYVDGVVTPIVTANYWFRGVLLDAGRHTVAFKYEPASFYLGSALSALGLIIIVVLLGSGFVRRPAPMALLRGSLGRVRG